MLRREKDFFLFETLLQNCCNLSPPGLSFELRSNWDFVPFPLSDSETLGVAPSSPTGTWTPPGRTTTTSERSLTSPTHRINPQKPLERIVLQQIKKLSFVFCTENLFSHVFALPMIIIGGFWRINHQIHLAFYDWQVCVVRRVTGLIGVHEDGHD